MAGYSAHGISRGASGTFRLWKITDAPRRSTRSNYALITSENTRTPLIRNPHAAHIDHSAVIKVDGLPAFTARQHIARKNETMRTRILGTFFEKNRPSLFTDETDRIRALYSLRQSSILSVNYGHTPLRCTQTILRLPIKLYVETFIMI